MQPYLFPYIGYWQLINAVDRYVIYDDVNFIKRGYINRNSILVNNHAQLFTLELVGASQNKLIHEIEVGENAIKILKTIKQNYAKAPFYDDVFPVIEEILTQKEKNLARFVGFSLEVISRYLGIGTMFLYSSAIDKDPDVRGTEKILFLCKKLGATRYINAIGGQELYDKEVFGCNGIELKFLETELQEYRQFKNDFVPYLSIIDVLMFNDRRSIGAMLNMYRFI